MLNPMKEIVCTIQMLFGEMQQKFGLSLVLLGPGMLL